LIFVTLSLVPNGTPNIAAKLTPFFSSAYRDLPLAVRHDGLELTLQDSVEYHDAVGFGITVFMEGILLSVEDIPDGILHNIADNSIKAVAITKNLTSERHPYLCFFKPPNA